MSLILEGIDLPEEYYYTSILILKDGSIFKQDENNGRYYQIGHEAIQIPEGHGRLIDADALFKDLREQQIPFNSDINSAINVAPTIFESEEE